MKYRILIAGLVAVAFSGVAAGEGSQSLSSTLEIYVFPAEGQSAEQQSKDEVECYNWAVSNTGSDPFDLAKENEQVAAEIEQQVAQTEAATQGGGGRAAVRGAAAGAIIGDLASEPQDLRLRLAALSFGFIAGLFGIRDLLGRGGFGFDELGFQGLDGLAET